jgi:type I restriction enzyme S subunit
MKKVYTPKIRFSSFQGDWRLFRIDEITERFVNPVNVDSSHEYQQIGIRSHGKGIFHKPFVTGEVLGKKRVFWLEKDLFIVNIVFAWEQAVAKTTDSEVGLIASHRFPMYMPKPGLLDLDFILNFFSQLSLLIQK